MTSRSGTPRMLALSAALGLCAFAPASTPTLATARYDLFQDQLFQQCINWMLDGTGGGLIENLCVEYYALPSPSLFQCARKVMTGFQSAKDQEGCAIIFEEQVKKVRAGYVK